MDEVGDGNYMLTSEAPRIVSIELERIVELEAEEYKSRDYGFSEGLVDDVLTYAKTIGAQEYVFEIRGSRINENTISVCVQGERKKFLTISFATYFGITANNEILPFSDDLVF